MGSSGQHGGRGGGWEWGKVYYGQCESSQIHDRRKNYSLGTNAYQLTDTKNFRIPSPLFYKEKLNAFFSAKL